MLNKFVKVTIFIVLIVITGLSGYFLASFIGDLMTTWFSPSIWFNIWVVLSLALLTAFIGCGIALLYITLYTKTIHNVKNPKIKKWFALW